MCCETAERSVTPLFWSLNIIVAFFLVVVNDHFVSLPIALTGSKHNGSCILKHGHEVRHDDCLCKQILGCAKQVGTLPTPSLLARIKIRAMTGPKGNMPVVETVCDLVWLRQVCDPRLAVIAYVAPLSWAHVIYLI